MFCLDTNVIIFAMNRRRPIIAERLAAELEAGTTLIVPTMVLFELEFGIAKSQRPKQARASLDHFLSAGFELPVFEADDAREAGQIRAFLEKRGTPIRPLGILIAAQARRCGSALVTLNHREFERVPQLIVTDWST